MKKSILLAGLIVIAASQSASAEGLQSWSGFYGGVNVGYGSSFNAMSSTTSLSPMGSTKATGGIYGAQVGYDIQYADWVFGGALSLNRASVNGTHVFQGGTGSKDLVSYNVTSLATLTARAGYLIQPSTLGYVKLGVASERINVIDADPMPDRGSAPYKFSGTKTRNAPFIGLGLEQKISANLSVFVDYSHYEFGREKSTLTIDYGRASGSASNYLLDQRMDHVSVGLNYRF